MTSSSVEHEILEVVVENGVFDVIKDPADVGGVDSSGEVMEERLAVVPLASLEPAL